MVLQIYNKGMRFIRRKLDIKRSDNEFPSSKSIKGFPSSRKISLVETLLQQTVVRKMQLKSSKKCIKVGLLLNNEYAVEYVFKYNKDKLLLLRGAKVKCKNREKYVLSQNSIPDFAIAAQPINKNREAEWVPNHGKKSGVSLNVVTNIFIDGKKTENQLLRDVESIKRFEIIQSFDAVNPGFPDEKMWRHIVSHKIEINAPYCEIGNKIEIEMDLEIKKMYLTMLPAASKEVARLVFNNGLEFEDIPANGIEVPLDKGISSAMFLGVDRYNSYGIAVDFLNSNVNTSRSLVTFRNDNVAKFYLDGFNGTVSAGAVFRHTQRIICTSGLDEKLLY